MMEAGQENPFRVSGHALASQNPLGQKPKASIDFLAVHAAQDQPMTGAPANLGHDFVDLLHPLPIA